MAYKKIGTGWTPGMREDIDSMFKELYDKYTNAGSDASEAKTQALEAMSEALIAKGIAETTREEMLDIINEQTNGGDIVPEVVQARGGETTLGERLNQSDQRLAQTEAKQNNYLQHFSESPYIVEKKGTIHVGGFPHTAFFGGCNFKNKEIYVGRNGETHVTTSGRSTIVAYVRNYDGTFDGKIIVPSFEYDPRDINLTPSRDGEKLFLSCACVIGDSSTNADYITYVWELDEELNVIGERKKLFDGFGWGNLLITPNGRFLKTRYQQSVDGVSLFRSINRYDNEDINSENIFALFPSPSSTECTLAYWNDKLIALTRVNGGNMLYRETYNLEGTDGWGEIVVLDTKGDAPALEPYNDNKTLLSIISLSTNTGRQQAVISTDNGYDWSAPVIVINETSSYGTIVPNRYGYGVMSYNEGGGSQVMHIDIDPNKVTKINTLDNIDVRFKLPTMLKRTVDGVDVIGDSEAYTYFDDSLFSRYIYFKVKEETSFNGLYLFTKNNLDAYSSTGLPRLQVIDGSTASTLYTLAPVNQSDIPTKNSNPERVLFSHSTLPLDLEVDKLYRLWVPPMLALGKTTLRNKNKTIINADLGKLVYVKTTNISDGMSYHPSYERFENNIYPFEIRI